MVTADLAAGTLTANTSVSTLSGFENLTLDDVEVDSHSEGTATSKKYVVYGTHANNGCSWRTAVLRRCRPRSSAAVGTTISGGGSANDLLNGGPGTDTGNGLRGTDTCVSIEVTPTTARTDR